MSTEHAFALVDCQNFYVSCERLFRPDLRERPVVVLSNNDGCIIARSKEVKALGVPMAAPYFEWRETLEAEDVVIFSSNYALYADLSRRVMKAIGKLAEAQEVYSIDESFLRLPALPPQALQDLGRRIRCRARKWTGLPVRVGIGQTKTLAKIANRMAKRAESDVFVMPPGAAAAPVLERVEVGDIWGIGPAYAKRLHQHGVQTARQLREVPPHWAKKRLSVVGQRIVWELQGRACLPLEPGPEERKSLTRSRSFSERIYERAAIQEAIAKHAARVAEKLREEELVARGMQVFITTRYFGKGPHHRGVEACELPRLTAHTPELIQAAHTLLNRIYRTGYGYRKAGVTLFDLQAEQPEQGHLFIERDPKEQALMQAVDAINQEMGRGTVFYAAQGTGRKKWHMQQQHKSPCYTTAWTELKRVWA